MITSDHACLLVAVPSPIFSSLPLDLASHADDIIMGVRLLTALNKRRVSRVMKGMNAQAFIQGNTAVILRMSMFVAIVQWSFSTILFLFLSQSLGHCHSFILYNSLQNYRYSLNLSLLCSTFYYREPTLKAWRQFRLYSNRTHTSLHHTTQVNLPAISFTAYSCWVFLVSTLFFRPNGNFTFFSVSFIFDWISGGFISLILSTCPVCIYSSCMYLYGCFTGHVFYSTRNDRDKQYVWTP